LKNQKETKQDYTAILPSVRSNTEGHRFKSNEVKTNHLRRLQTPSPARARERANLIVVGLKDIDVVELDVSGTFSAETSQAMW
jgi:hypothetical protein